VTTKLFAQTPTPNDDPPRSDLRSLLPTPKKQSLPLDKYGRRIHDLTDDGTAKYSKELRGNPVPSSKSSISFGKKSQKELAAEASSADFGREVKSSTDLKALLPTQKMRFMKLDKFGRRVQRMEDDGTVNMKKEPTLEETSSEAAPTATNDDDSNVEEPIVDNIEPPPIKASSARSPSLAQILGKGADALGVEQARNDAILGEGNRSVDLKELLPKQKMRFMKLDKFGRRVERMEDDGTVNMKKVPSGTAAHQSSSMLVGQSSVAATATDSSTSDLGEEKEEEEAELEKPEPNYGSLKDLLPTRRATWTKLDFKGAPIPDDRRTKKNTHSSSNNAPISSGSGSLKELLPKRAVWTKLDFHGASVVDERRTKKSSSSSSSTGSGGSSGGGGKGGGVGGSYTNLKTLLPERTITWKKTQVLSSGSSPTVSRTGRGLREERQRTMREEVIASAAAAADAATTTLEEDEDDRDDNVGDDSDGKDLEEEVKAYTNLKDLLPERKMTWRSVK